MRSTQQRSLTASQRLQRSLDIVVEIVSSEWLLTRLPLQNGGGIILLRSLLTSLEIYILIVILYNEQISTTPHWFGAIFAAVYAGFYARFASQWSYLANLYNQIKATECTKDCNADELAKWKAGFIEDAEELHLAAKPLFASVLLAWAGDQTVKAMFEKYTPGGTERFDRLMRCVEAVWQERARRS